MYLWNIDQFYQFKWPNVDANVDASASIDVRFQTMRQPKNDSQ